MWSFLKEKLEKSALFKTILNIFSIVIFSILSGTFVSEITNSNGVIVWQTFYSTKSFYLLIACCLIMYLYFKFQFSIDESVEKYKDDEYCKAYIRKQCLPEIAKKANQWIKDGKSNGRLKNIMSDLKL